MKHRRIKGTEVYEFLCRIFDHLEISGNDRKHYCQYIGKEGRYCKATTHKSCKGCKMFTPTTQTKIMAIIEHDLQLEEDIRRIKIKNYSLENKIEYLEKEIQSQRDYYREGLGNYSAVGKAIARHRRKIKKAANA